MRKIQIKISNKEESASVTFNSLKDNAIKKISDSGIYAVANKQDFLFIKDLGATLTLDVITKIKKNKSRYLLVNNGKSAFIIFGDYGVIAESTKSNLIESGVEDYTLPSNTGYLIFALQKK